MSLGRMHLAGGAKSHILRADIELGLNPYSSDNYMFSLVWNFLSSSGDKLHQMAEILDKVIVVVGVFLKVS